MERENHIRSLDKLIEILGKLSLFHAPAFWYAYSLYQSAKATALKSRLISKQEIAKYDEKIKVYVQDCETRNKIRIAI